MKTNKYISKTEHKLLLIVAFIAFIIFSAIFAGQVTEAYDNFFADRTSKIRFSGSGNQFQAPLFHLLTLFIFAAILKTKRFLLSSFLTVFYALVFIYGLSARYDGGLLGGEEFSPKVDFLDKVYRAATDFDYLAALFISILLFWQISILLRMLIRTLQKESVLP